MNQGDITRDDCMLQSSLARKGYDWRWHSFTAENLRTGGEKFYEKPARER